jgi:hypothetical protein
MEAKFRELVPVVCLVAIQLAYSGCASDTSDRRESRNVEFSPDSSSAHETKGRRRPRGSFDVECNFGITGCESQASERCGHVGFHVIGSYRTQGAFGAPYYYMKAACGPAPGGASTSVPAPAPQASSTVPSPALERQGADRPGDFEVECRFGISGCESQASERCGYVGYHALSSYKTQGAFGTPYWYMKAACGPAPTTKPSSPSAPP